MLSSHVPVDFAVIAFPGNQFKGEIAPEIYNLVERGFIRVIDILFISKNQAGEYTALELNELPPELYGQFMPFDEQLARLFTDEDVATAAAYVPNDSAALVLLWQNVWTEDFRRAVQNADGRLLVHERIPAEDIELILDEIAAAGQ
jgi:hypothetical protein